MSNLEIDQQTLIIPSRRKRDRLDGNNDMANLLYILDRRKAIAAFHIEQNNNLRNELKLERVKRNAWFESAIASWLVTLAILTGLLVSKLS